MEELEAWDTEMDALVKWLEQFQFPKPPFKIGEALRVIDLDVFMKDLRLSIDRCEFHKESIGPLRFRLKSIKAYMES